VKGSMRQRGANSWHLRVYAGYDSATGRRRYLERTLRGTKREAQRELAAMITSVDQVGLPANVTVGTVLERWYDLRSPDWSPRTAVQQRSILDRYLLPEFGRRRLDKLKAADIDAFYGRLRKLPGRRDETLSAASIQRVHSALRAALNQAVRWGWLTNNPAAWATPPTEHPPEIVPPDPQLVQQALALVRAEDPEFFTFLRLAAATGARRSQRCALQWGDIDLDVGRIIFRRAVVKGAGGIVVKDTKNHRAYRVVLDAITAAVLVEHRQLWLARTKAASVELDDSCYVFAVEPSGRELTRPEAMTMRWVRLRKRAGLGHSRLHDLRHFAATSMLGAGVPVHVVAGRLGHARPTTTLNVYSHFIESGDRAAAEAMSGIIDRRLSETPS
jgi:integrase